MPPVEAGAEELQPLDVIPASSLVERLAAAAAYVALIGVDVVLKLLGFHHFYRMMRAWPRVGQKPQKHDAVAYDTCAAVDRAATYYFNRAWCLQRSATTVCLLRLRGIDAELVIGVQKIPFAAHAWVEANGKVINNHPIVRQRYQEIERC